MSFGQFLEGLNPLACFLYGLNWQAIVAMFMINGFFYWLIKAEIDVLTKRLESLDERMFYLATGKTLADAIKAEKLKSLS